MTKPMERLNAYSTRVPGGTKVDVEGMAVDLVSVMKAFGCPRHEFLELMAQTWDSVEVAVDYSKVTKQ